MIILQPNGNLPISMVVSHKKLYELHSLCFGSSGLPGLNFITIWDEQMIETWQIILFFKILGGNYTWSLISLDVFHTGVDISKY